MALDPSATYPGQIATGDAGYPYGKAQNITVEGDGTGTPWEADIVNDLLGFEQALLVEAGVTPSGAPDEVGDSDYVTALHTIAQQHAHSNAIANHVGRTPDASFTSQFKGAAWSGTQFVLVGQTGEIQTSPDGVTWTARTPAGGFTGPSNTFNGIYADGTLCVAVGTQDMIQTSPDGITWTVRAPAGGYVGTEFKAVAKSPALYVIVGGGGMIQTSPDGVTWTARTPAGGFTLFFHGVTWTGTQFVAVGGAGEIQTSPDGVTWTQRATGATYNLFSVAVSTEWLVAVGGEPFVDEPAILTSPDGVTWTARTPDAGYDDTISHVAWTGRVFVAFGVGGVIQSSPTGRAWTSLTRAIYTTVVNCAVAGDGTIVMAGSTGSIRQSMVIHS